MFAHGFTFGAHPVAAAVALANLDIFEREDLCGHVREHEARVPRDARRPARPADRRRRARRRLLPRDRARQGQGDEGDASTTRSPSDLLRGFLSGELYRRGLICRADDRGDPVVQLAPPLIAGDGAVRGDRGDPARRAERGVGPHGRLTRRIGMLTVQSLLDELGLSLAAGKESAEAPIRWVHISELLDPTPWMSGGELLLTTGIQLHERRRAARASCGGSSTTTSPASGSASASSTSRSRRRSSRRPSGTASRCSRCRTRCRSSRSPRRRSRASSTSSTRCSSAASRCTAAWSSSCSSSAAWERSRGRCRRRSAARS